LKKYISVLLILLFCTTAYSQAENNPEDKNGITNSITTFEEKFAFKVEYKSDTIEYVLHYEDNNDFATDNIEYLNEGDSMSLNFSVSYLDYSASISFDTGEIDNITDFKLSKYSRKYWVDLNYQNYHGFYIQNSQDFSMWHYDGEHIKSDLEITNYNANYVYIFSDDFSIAAAMEQTERQNSWDWTFLLGASSGMFEIKSKNSMLPPSEELLYENYSGYTGGEYYYIAVMPGFAITVPIWKFFITYAVLLGGGYAYNINHTADGDICGNTNMFKFLSKGSIGFNGDNWFALFTLTFDQSEVSTFTSNNIVPSIAVVTSGLAAGVRF